MTPYRVRVVTLGSQPLVLGAVLTCEAESAREYDRA